MSTAPKDATPKPSNPLGEPAKKPPLNVALPPVDATPEEIAQALVRCSRPRPPDAEESDDS